MPIGLARDLIMKPYVAAGTILHLDDEYLVNNRAISMYRKATSMQVLHGLDFIASHIGECFMLR